MASKYWLKLYYDMLDDPKIGKLRPALRWRFIECLLVAGECEDEGFLPDITAYSWRVRANAETIETDFVALADEGLLSQDNGRWLVTNFAKRQAPVDATERWRRWRDRKRQQEYQQEQTNFQRDPTEAQTNRLIDKDTDKDTDKIQRRKLPSLPVHLAAPAMMNVWGEWCQYHVDRGKPLTRTTTLKQFKRIEKMGIERAVAALDYSMEQSYVGIVEPKLDPNGQKEPPKVAPMQPVETFEGGGGVY